KIVNAGIQSLPVALETYGPDGVWLEGPGYWHYATRYTGYGISALETALGSDFNLTGIEGMRETGAFPIYTTGPTGLYLNFADSGEWRKRNPMPVLFWLADEYNSSFFANSEHRLLRTGHSEPEHVVWYQPQDFAETAQPDLDRVFEGDVDVAVFRSEWHNPEALFVGVKSGYNQVNHGHLDLGNFELDALGVRWARDLGSDNYNLPNYWGKDEGAQRWDYYRLNSRSHNVPLINNDNQDVYATSDFLRHETGVDEPFVIVDLTEAYEDYSTRTYRGVKMVRDRKAILVQDEFDLSQRSEVKWGMTTDAEIEIQNRHSAILTIDDKTLQATILSPRRARFQVESAEQEPPQKKNIGVHRLIVDTGKKRRNLQISVLLAPVWSTGETVTDLQIEELENW
ncbi:MAG: heparinase, partial [Candidatus Marinimicrobia bacterium]|nr:heparinase [Candidatus Neomarinimicrobiota bacterium]